jgi:hypothetical protein
VNKKDLNIRMSSNAKNNAPTTNAEVGGTTGSKLMSAAKGSYGIITFSVISIALFIWSFVSMSQFVGSKDDWNLIQPQITKILILTLIGTFGLIIAALLYFIQDSARTIYFILVLSCISLGLSYSALAISAISR